MFLPLPKTDNNTIREELNSLNEGLSEGLSEGLNSLLAAVQSNPGIQANKIMSLLNNRPIKTIERQIKALVEKGLIERRGSKKTGGYFIKRDDYFQKEGK